MIDIGILDPHHVVRAGLRRLMSDQIDMRIVGEAASTDEAVKLVSGSEKLGVLVLDLPQPGQRGFDAMVHIRAMAPELRVLVFTAHPAEHYAIEALRQGAGGFLNKNCEPTDIVDAVRTLSEGRRYFSPTVTDLLADQLDRSYSGAAHEQLSAREFQVFYQLARGATSAAIAATLALSVKSVSTYRTRLLEKLNLSSNCDLTYYAVNNQLITCERAVSGRDGRGANGRTPS